MDYLLGVTKGPILNPRNLAEDGNHVFLNLLMGPGHKFVNIPPPLGIFSKRNWVT